MKGVQFAHVSLYPLPQVTIDSVTVGDAYPASGATGGTLGAHLSIDDATHDMGSGSTTADTTSAAGDTLVACSCSMRSSVGMVGDVGGGRGRGDPVIACCVGDCGMMMPSGGNGRSSQVCDWSLDARSGDGAVEGWTEAEDGEREAEMATWVLRRRSQATRTLLLRVINRGIAGLSLCLMGSARAAAIRSLRRYRSRRA